MQNDFVLRKIVKKFPRLYYFLVVVFGPIYFSGLNPKKFLSKYDQSGVKLNLGSGPKKIGADVLNVDIHPYIGVDIVSDIHLLPLENDSVSMIVCDTVLEHVLEPEKVISEMYRVLKIGGLCYISTPFLYPYHPSPHDYTRWTSQGLDHLVNNFTIVEKGVRCGIASTFSVNLSYFFATLFCFGSEKAFGLLVDLSLILFFPIKFLDIVLNKFSFSKYTASVLYIVARK